MELHKLALLFYFWSVGNPITDIPSYTKLYLLLQTLNKMYNTPCQRSRGALAYYTYFAYPLKQKTYPFKKQNPHIWQIML